MDKIIEQNVALAKEKNSQAMSFLYEHFYKDVYYTCLKFLNNEELAKDMTHDTFIKAFEKLDDLSDDTKFKSWICQIANRLSLNYIKRSNIITFEEMPESEELLSSSYEGDKTPEDITVDNEVATTLLQAIAKLPNDQRICVFMFYYENMSVKEIASQIECTENTVRGKLRYASNNLQKYIENLGDNGLKLRCIGILPFLYAIFNVERASITATPSAQALASIAQISGNVVNSALLIQLLPIQLFLTQLLIQLLLIRLLSQLPLLLPKQVSFHLSLQDQAQLPLLQPQLQLLQ